MENRNLKKKISSLPKNWKKTRRSERFKVTVPGYSSTFKLVGMLVLYLTAIAS